MRHNSQFIRDIEIKARISVSIFGVEYFRFKNKVKLSGMLIYSGKNIDYDIEYSILPAGLIKPREN